MTRRFVLVAEVSTAEEDKAFQARLKQEFPGIAWWHWFSNMWLIKDTQGRLNAVRLRDIAKEVLTPARAMVVEINDDGDTWASLGPSDQIERMYQWVHKYWKSD